MEVPTRFHPSPQFKTTDEMLDCRMRFILRTNKTVSWK